MVLRKNNLPFGFGRAIRTDKTGYMEGQFKHGKLHGNLSWINSDGIYED
jgi:hypothetical protein